MEKIFADAVGYAVFPTVGKGGIGIGARGARAGCTGRRAHRPLDPDPGDLGLQLGGQAYSEIVFFQTRQALDNFKPGRLKLRRAGLAIALTARASADLAYRNGVAIVTMAKGGLMYEASVGGRSSPSRRPADRQEWGMATGQAQADLPVALSSKSVPGFGRRPRSTRFIRSRHRASASLRGEAA